MPSPTIHADHSSSARDLPCPLWKRQPHSHKQSSLNYEALDACNKGKRRLKENTSFHLDPATCKETLGGVCLVRAWRATVVFIYPDCNPRFTLP